MLLLLASAVPAAAQYTTRFTTNANGAVLFVGNTLGLDKAANANGPGTNGSIGTFITTDTSARNGTLWPFGTTASWSLNRSAATLAMPAGSTVLYAELIWGGSYSAGGQDVSASLNTPVTFITPNGSNSISPDGTTAKTLGTAGPSGTCLVAPCTYTRTANVTALVVAAGNGTYTVGGVPATVSSTENNSNTAGWTLAIIYQNFSLPTRNLTVFTGAEVFAGAAAQVSGFCTPTSGTLSGRLAVTAIEGDANITGDQMLFGPTNVLTVANQVSGPRNPATNFFASQITTATGTLDTTGTFGTVNHTAGSPVSGARQGWDIVHVDASAQLQNGQTSAFARGTSTGDQYVIAGLGLQIDIGAPAFIVDVKTVDKATTFIGDTLTYTITLKNTGITNATNVIFTDTPPAGTSFIANSLTIDGTTQGGANPGAGVTIGTIAPGTQKTVQFKVLVNSVPAFPTTAIYANSASWTYQYQSCAGQPIQNGNFTTNTVETRIARIQPTIDTVPTTAVPGQVLTYTIQVPNTGTHFASSVNMSSVIPAGTTYVLGSTKLNGIAVADNLGTMPYSTAQPVSSPGAAAGLVAAGQTATITFQVLVDPARTTSISGSATIDPDGAGGLPVIPVAVVTSVTPRADLQITKAGTLVTVPGGIVTYTTRVYNAGPSTATSVVVNEPLPTQLLFFSNAGACVTNFPCNVGTIAPGTERVFTTTYTVPLTYTGPNKITATSTVTSATTDPTPGNNVATASTSIGAPITQLTIITTDGIAVATPGTPLTYTVIVNNAGPDAAVGATVTDVFPAAFQNPVWTCIATPLSSCPAANGTGNINGLVTLIPGGAATFLVTGTIDPAATGSLVNTASVTPPANAADPTSGTSTDTDLLVPISDVSIILIPQPTVVPGNPITYTATITNNGPSNAYDVIVQDPEDPLLIFVSNSGGCTTPFPCALGTMTPGESRVITSIFTLVPEYLLPAIGQEMEVSSTSNDPNLLNNVAIVSTIAEITADIGVDMTVSPQDNLVNGSTVVITVTATNYGPNNATNVVITDVIPAGFTFISASPTEGTYDPATGTWYIAALEESDIEELVITLVVNRTGSITNVATKTRADQPDLDTSNDSHAVTVNAAPAADVRIEIDVNNTAPNVGQTVTFTVVATNGGPNTVTNLLVRDLLPAGLTFVSATPTQGSYDPVSGNWTVGTIAPNNATATMTLQALVTATGPIANTAQKISQTEADPNTQNDSATASLNASTSTDIQIAVTGSTPTPAVGDLVTLIVTARDNGPSDATGVAVSYPLPSSLQFVEYDSSQGTYNSATGLWTVGALARTQSGKLTIQARVLTPGTITTTATMTAHDQTDPQPNNDSGTFVMNASRVSDLRIVAASPSPSATPGLPYTYTLTVTNAGPSAVTAASIVDTLPAALLNPSWTCAPSAGSSCATPGPVSGNVNTTASMPSGGTVTITITGTIAASTAPGDLNNTATVAPPAGTTDPDSNNNSSTTTATVTPSADVRVLASGPTSAVAGTQVNYLLQVINAGPSDAAAVTLTAPTPAGLTLVSVGGGCAALPCSLGTIAAGAQRNIPVVFSLPPNYNVPSGSSPDPIVFTGTASSASTSDPQTTNNSSTASTSVGSPVANLSVTMSDGKTQVTAGTTVTYTIVITNAGPSAAVNAHIVDTAPASLTNVSWTCTAAAGSTCPAPTGTGSLDQLMTVGTTGNVTFTLTGTVDPAAQGTLSNSVTVTPPAGTSDPDGAQASDSNQIVQQSELAIVTTGPAVIVSGANVPYTITVTNNGPSNATNVNVSTIVSPGLTFASNTGACASAFPCTIGTVPAGESRTITATYTAGQTFSSGATVTVTSKVTATPPDPVSANNTSSATSAVRAFADVDVRMTASPAAGVLVGDQVVYTITVTNHGPNQATGLTISDPLPAGLSFVSATTGTGSYDPVSGLWTIGTVPSQGTVTLTLVATVTQPGAITNTAAMTSGNEPDPDPSNNAAAVRINGDPTSDVAVSMVASNTDPAVGDTVMFHITVTNRGPVVATNLAILDQLPAGLTFVTAAPSQGAYSSGTGLWTIGTLAVNTSVTLDLTATATTTATQTNAASKVTHDQFDPVPANDAAAVTLHGSSSADLQLSSTVSNPAPAVGEEVTFTVTVRNNGPGVATNVTVLESLPPGLQFVSASPSEGNYDPSGGQWFVGTLTPSQSSTLAVTARVTVPGPITVNAQRGPFDQTDPYAPNDGTSSSINGALIADIVTSSTHSGTPVPGLPLTYTVVVRNLGPSDALLTPVTDTFPADLTGVTWTCTATSGSSCVLPAGAGNINTLVSLLSGGSATFVATGIMNPSATPGAAQNTAFAAPPAGTSDPNMANNTAVDSASTNASADVVVGVTGATSATPGTNTTFVITVTNDGPSTATNVSVDMPTPSGVDFVSTTGDCLSAFPCTLGSLLPGDTRSIVVTYSIPSPYSGPDPMTATATATTDTADPSPSNNSASASTSFNAPVTDLTVLITDGATTATPGDPITYTITVANNGPSTAIDARVFSNLPTALTGVTWSCVPASPCTTASGINNVDTLFTLISGASFTITVNGTIAPNATGQLSAVVAATAADGASDPTSATASDDDTLTPSADVQITSAGPATITPGTLVTYTWTVTNTGPSTAVGVTLDNPTPPGLQFVSNTGGCTTAYPCSFGDLAPGATRVVTATFSVPAGYATPDPIVNTATVSSGTPDPGAPNSSSVSSPVSASADLTLTMTGPATVVPGRVASYVITVTNDGPSTATNVTLANPTPAGLTINEIDGVCASFPCNLGSLAPGSHVVVTVRFDVPGNYSTPDPIVNAANVTSPVTDPTPADNNDSVSTAVAEAETDLVLTATGPATVLPGATATFDLVARNDGPSAVTGAVLTYVLPDGVTFESISNSAGSCTTPAVGSSGTIVCTVDLASGAAMNVQIVARIAADLEPGALVSTAGGFTSPVKDPTADNNVAKTTSRVAIAGESDLSIDPIPPVTPVVTGGSVLYTMTVRNAGPEAASDPVVTLTIPAGLTLVAATPGQGSCTGNVCDLGPIPAGGSTTIQVELQTSTPGAFSVPASVDASLPDGVPANNSVAADITVGDPTSADVAVEVTGESTLARGMEGTYVVRVTNRGPGTATDVTLSAILPAGVTITALSGDCNDPAACSFATIPAGATRTVHVQVLVAPDYSGPTQASGTAIVQSASDDPRSDNNASTVTSLIADPTDADVTVTKIDTPDAAVGGRPLTYIFQVTNRGPGLATDITISDTLPAGMSATSATASQGSCTAGATVTCNIGNLELGQNAIITVVAETPAVMPDTNPVVNTVTVQTTSKDPDLATNAASAETTIAPRADIQITATTAATTVVPGTTVTYDVTITNLGTTRAEGVLVNADIVPSLQFVSATGVCAGGLPCAIGAMDAGAVLTFSVTYRTPDTYTVPDPLVNTFNVGSTTPDPSLLNNSASVSVPVGAASADLSVTMTGPDNAVVGDVVTYTIVVRNNGPSAAAGVVLADPTPAGLVFESASGPCNGGFPCDLGSISANATATVTVSFRIPANSLADSTTNVASVSSDTADPVASNNSASATTTIAGKTDLRLTLTTNNTTPSVGQVVRLTLTVINDGPTPATGVEVTSQLPFGLEFLTATPTTGTFDPSTGLWEVGNLGVGEQRTLIVDAHVRNSGALAKVATITGLNQPDPDTSNNTAGVALNVPAAADLQVSMVSDQSEVALNEVVTFTITLRNAGPDTAHGVNVTDLLPAGLSFMGATATQGSYTAGTGVWNVGDLPAGAEITLQITAQVTAGGAITNSARVTASGEFDPAPANNESGVTLSGPDADIHVIKTVSDAHAAVGQVVTFTITAVNVGPDAVDGVQITDLLPNGLLFVAGMPSQGHYLSNTGVWHVGSLAAFGEAATATLQITATVTQPGVLTNTASVTAASLPDPTTSNNGSSVSVGTAHVDLAASIVVATPNEVGAVLDFGVIARNLGEGTHDGPLTVTIVLPPYLQLTQTPPGYTCTVAGPVVTCVSNGPVIVPPGAAVQLDFRAVPIGDPVPAQLSATLSSPQDMTPGNNSASVSLLQPPGPPADLQISETVNLQLTTTSWQTSYDVLVRNAGPNASAINTVTSNIPANATVLNAFVVGGAPCTVNAVAIVCNLGPLNSGETRSLVIEFSGKEAGLIDHQISVFGNGPDPELANNTALTTTTVNGAIFDGDGDGLPTWWEEQYGLDPTVPNQTEDPDNDELTNIDEYLVGSHPRGFIRRYFAEGADNAFFRTEIALLNAENTPARLLTTLLGQQGPLSRTFRRLDPKTRVTYQAQDLLGGADDLFSILIESDIPFSADRAMYWDSREYGTSLESAIVAPSADWYFAEGSTSIFDLFYLLENPWPRPVNATIRYLRPFGAPIEKPIVLAPQTRTTVWVNAYNDPALTEMDLSAHIIADGPIVVERAMYHSQPGEIFSAGHASAGAPAPSTSWFFAEGATGDFFDAFLLMANPTSNAGTVTVRYQFSDGSTLTKSYPIGAFSRYTVQLDADDPRLASTSFSMSVNSTVPIVAERAMWWPGPQITPQFWYEAHDVLGATSTSPRWGVAGGFAGGDAAAQTFVLVANNGSSAVNARLTVVYNDGTTSEKAVTLPGTSRQTYDIGTEFPEARGRQFSVIVESLSDPAAQLVVEVSRYDSRGGRFWATGMSALGVQLPAVPQ